MINDNIIFHFPSRFSLVFYCVKLEFSLSTVSERERERERKWLRVSWEDEFSTLMPRHVIISILMGFYTKNFISDSQRIILSAYDDDDDMLEKFENPFVNTITLPHIICWLKNSSLHFNWLIIHNSYVYVAEQVNEFFRTSHTQKHLIVYMNFVHYAPQENGKVFLSS